ncbi:MAG: PQQ-dependent sugar dehydrogenase [Alphaproteobacteria bacterium]
MVWALGGFAAAQDRYETEKLTIQVETVAAGLDHPWGMTFLPGLPGEPSQTVLLVTERSGRLRIITFDKSADGAVGPPVAGLPEVAAVRQGGLLDVAADPDFATNKLIYFTYSARGEGGAGTAVGRGVLTSRGNRGVLSDFTGIFAMNRFSRSGVHYGSRLAFAPDGTLFVTVGERGERERAQDPFDHAGSVIRINNDGTVPADNPFAPAGVMAGKGAPEIWSTGHRNPQGAAINPADGALWITEHGPRGGDELNRPQPGGNYGWPQIGYGRHYSGARIGVGQAADGYEQPVHFWDPSIAPSGLTFCTSDLFPEWSGNLFAGALKFQLLVRLELDGDMVVHEEQLLKRRYGRIRDVCCGPDGALWLLTDEDDGKVLLVTPAG